MPCGAAKLCASLLLYSALTLTGEKNFYSLLGTIAANMGHSLPELLGGYIGTGIIAILQRTNLLPMLNGKPRKS